MGWSVIGNLRFELGGAFDGRPAVNLRHRQFCLLELPNLRVQPVGRGASHTTRLPDSHPGRVDLVEPGNSSEPPGIP